MFDGLKEKLSGITSDAEEDVEVEEDEAEPEEGEPEEPVPDGEALAEQSVANGATEAQDKPTPDQQAASATVETADSESEQHTEGSPSESLQPDTEDDQANEPAEDESPDESGDDSSRGLTERAKLFATGKTVIDEDDLESHLDDLEFALLSSDVELEVANEILDGVEQNLVGETRRRLEGTGNIVRDALREALYDVIRVGQFDFDQRVLESEKPFVVIFTGVNGVGKTTSIAKLAQYFEDRGLSTVLANGDTFRAGANEQLEQHAKNLDKKVISHEQGSDPAAVIYDAVEYAEAHDVDVVLGDTAGRLHTSDGLMDQLEKIDRVIDPDMTLFVDEAVAGQDAVNRASEFDDASEIDGTVLTKADADPQGGAAISISHVTGKPILFLGTGQDYNDIELFEPEQIVDQLLGEPEN